MAVSVGREYIQNILNKIVQDGGFDSVLKTAKILSAGNGSLSAVMKVDKEHANRGGMLHGGMTSLIVDQMSNLALFTIQDSKLNTAGVSIALNVSFMRTVPIGQEILIKASTDKVGNKIAFLTVEILNRNGQLCAKGMHTKYIGTNMLEAAKQ